MRDTGSWVRAAGAVVVWLFAGSVWAAETQEQRIAEVVAARIELQRSLSEWLAGTLAQPAAPFRVDPVVQITLRGEVRELQQQEETTGGDVKFGGKTSMKLPGLGYADAGAGNGQPEVVLRGPGKRTTRTLRQLDMNVTRLVVRLYVDPAMPKDRRELVRTLAADLVGLEPARGDELHVIDLPGFTVAAAAAETRGPGGSETRAVPASGPMMPASYERRGFDAGAVIPSLAALGAAAILAFGLSRRGSAGGAAGGRDGGEPGGELEIADGRVIDFKSGAAAHAATEKRRETGAFLDLADATPRELAEVLVELDPMVAAVVIDTAGLSDDVAARFHALAPAARRVEVGLWLGKSRVIARSELSQMETAAGAALARVRSRVAVGGASRLASFLAGAPDDSRKELLEGVATRDAALADAARGELMVFDDLARLTEKSVRRVLTGIDPGVVAIALVGAGDALREAVLSAVSKRLRGMIESEAESVGERPARDVEAARRLVERAMFQLHTRGELVSRAA
jgi:hypothetical protein